MLAQPNPYFYGPIHGIDPWNCLNCLVHFRRALLPEFTQCVSAKCTQERGCAPLNSSYIAKAIVENLENYARIVPAGNCCFRLEMIEKLSQVKNAQ